MKTQTIGFVGAGNMATALIEGLLHAGVLPHRIAASDVKGDRLAHLNETKGIRTMRDNRALLRESELFVLSVKPQVMDRVLTELGREVTPSHLVISVAAGRS